MPNIFSRNYPLTYECFEYCTHEEALCIGGCTNNSTCTYECGIAASCKFYCPCAEGCQKVTVENHFYSLWPIGNLSILIQHVTIALMTSAYAEIIRKIRTISLVKITMTLSTGIVCLTVIIMTMCVMLTVIDSTMKIFKTVPVSPTVPMAVHVPTMTVRTHRQLQVH